MTNMERRFWSKVDIRKLDECWNWKRSKRGGYGKFWADKEVGAHRYAYESYYKVKIPKGKMVLHKCDNRACCNPKHLYLGNAQDNMNDLHARGKRGITGNPSKLYAGEIWLIRRLKRIKTMKIQGKGRQDFIASMFNTNQSVISRIWSSNKYLCKEGYLV